MSRIARLLGVAVIMLALAVGIAGLLQDEAPQQPRRSEISGKIAGLTDHQNKKNRLVSEGMHGYQSSAVESAPLGVSEEKASRGNGVPESVTVIQPQSFSEIPVQKKNSSETATSVESFPVASAAETEPKHGSTLGGVQKTSEEQNSEDVVATAVLSNKSAAPEKLQSYDRVVTSARFVMSGSQIKLVLYGNAPMVGHYLILKEPDRVVLDLAGNWAIDIPHVPSNRLIQTVRVGQHEDKTRLVFDMKTAGRVALVPLNRNALELRIQ